MIRKMWHKKWLFCCLLLGSILLIATASSYPMYRNAVFNRMLQDEFTQELKSDGEWPAKIKMVIVSKSGDEMSHLDNVENFVNGIYDELNVTKKLTMQYYSLMASAAYPLSDPEDGASRELRLSYLAGLSEHAEIIAGEMYSDSGMTEDGAYEVIISEAAMLEQDVVIGDEFEFDKITDPSGEKSRFKIVGVFAESDADDFYWQMRPSEMNNIVFMNEALFREQFTGDNAGRSSITCRSFMLFEYDDILSTDADDLIDRTEDLLMNSPYKTVLSDTHYTDILEEYKTKESRISTTLFILQVPVMLLLCAFLLMISGQMYEMERNEISVLKSRGASRGQIFRLYLYQSMLLSGVGLAAGLPLGGVFCRILGSANNFLEFGIERKLNVTYSGDVFLYAGTAVLISILIMAIPALKHSRLSIVNLKQQKATKKHALWERCFLDVIFLAVSLYGFYNFSRHSNNLLESALKNEPLDPLLYISSSLFILGMGMLFLRLQPLLAKGIYLIGRNHWKPASYASFMETMKNGRKQQYIMLFMILTTSLGMFNAVSARTIMQNTLNNTEYIEGADLIMQEAWKDNSRIANSSPSIEFQYYEPDYSRFETMTGAKSYTRVLDDKKAYITMSNNERQPVEVMGIHTKEFGEITNVPNEILAQPYYQYLNDLAVASEGILVSSNFRSVMGYQIGDQVGFTSGAGVRARGTIVGFFDYWPTYEATTVFLDDENNVNQESNYMIVGHLSTLQQFWNVTPYQVWIDVEEGQNTDFFYDWVRDNNVSLTMYMDRTEELTAVVEDPLLQGMNGVLTMSFIVMLILCAVGYLIYWIMSIRSREMMFGVLRAFGMHKEELLHMLVNEQVFSGIYSILSGFVIGNISYRMFVPMLQMAYSTTSQVLPLTLITQMSDMIRLYTVVGLTMVVCLTVLATLVFKLNITKALKLGEE